MLSQRYLFVLARCFLCRVLESLASLSKKVASKLQISAIFRHYFTDLSQVST